MSARYTPGPYRKSAASLDGFTPVMAQGGRIICLVSVLSSNAEDDATLLAASPELFEALIAALPYVEMAEHDEAYKPGAVRKIVNQMRAAIRKAGEPA